MSDEDKVNELLDRLDIMVLGVVQPDGTPWVVPVKIKRREGRILEWDSLPDTEHSKSLEKQPIMSVTVYDKQPNHQICVCMKGRGELRELTHDGKVGRYRFTVDVAWLNDETFVKREVKLG